jgi:AbrB family looped-hinge helix DNA binding protein
MSTTEKPDTVSFTTKGQVVIPLRLRKQFEIEEGTKAVVQATPEGILLKPVTAALIRRGRGILKRSSGLDLQKRDLPKRDLPSKASLTSGSLKADWAEHKRQERALEDRHAR